MCSTKYPFSVSPVSSVQCSMLRHLLIDCKEGVARRGRTRKVGSRVAVNSCQIIVLLDQPFCPPSVLPVYTLAGTCSSWAACYLPDI